MKHNYRFRCLSVLNAASVVLAASLLLSSTSARAVLLVEDNFDNTVSGAVLTGTFPNVAGDSQWAAWLPGGQHAYTQNGAVSLNWDPNTGTSAGSVIAFGNYDKVANPIQIVQADITLGADAPVWAGVNFSGGAGGSPFGAIFSLINTNGSVNLFTSAAGYQIATGNIAGFDITQAYTIALEYNYSAQTARVLINGAVVIADTSLLITQAGDPAPAIGEVGAAGFFAYGTVYPNGSLDNFSVQAVPEPNTAAFVLAGVAGWVVVSRLRRKSVA